jgi:hypothetical protein
VDPVARTLEIYELLDRRYQEIDIFEGDARVRARPFDEVELDLSEWWRRRRE